MCWMAYACVYLCRSNLSIVLPIMKDIYGWNNAVAGTIGSAFFWAYAIGQLINGWVGDKQNPRYFIPMGLLGSAIINLLIGFFHNIYFIIAVWALNGFLLAMVWGPIVKITAAWFPPKRRTKVAVGLALSMIGGYILAWGLVGVIINYTSWEWGFFLPGIFTLIYAVVFMIFMRANPTEVGYTDYSGIGQDKTAGKISEKNSISLVQLIKREKLLFIALACVAQGVIKDGITLWTPTILSDSYGLSQSVVSIVSTVVPLVSIGGIFLAGWLNTKYKEREKRPLLILLALTASCCLVLLVVSGKNMYADVLLLSFSSALMYGANMLLLTMIPLNFAKYGKASGVTGFLDFCAYMGAGLSGFVTGWIVDMFGWSMVAGVWAVLAVVGILGTLAGYQRNHQQTI